MRRPEREYCGPSVSESLTHTPPFNTRPLLSAGNQERQQETTLNHWEVEVQEDKLLRDHL
jgi:hypothetical protein